MGISGPQAYDLICLLRRAAVPAQFQPVGCTFAEGTDLVGRRNVSIQSGQWQDCARLIRFII